jgi:hypothetical protein
MLFHSYSRKLGLQVRRSTVVDGEKGKSKANEARTSYGVFLRWDPILSTSLVYTLTKLVKQTVEVVSNQ